MEDNQKKEAAPSSKTKKQKVDGRRAPKTKTKILDAAEALFSRRGFYGVSLRDIATEAGVQLALSYYHFGSKEDLFGRVIERRAEENKQGLQKSLQEALLVKGSQDVRRTAIIRAFVMPTIDKSLRFGAGWKNYIRLLAQIANFAQDEDYMATYRKSFDQLVAEFVQALQDIHPEMDEDDVHWCFFFLQAAITHILVESTMLDRQSRGRIHASDLDLIADKMLVFFSAGFSGFQRK